MFIWLWALDTTRVSYALSNVLLHVIYCVCIFKDQLKKKLYLRCHSNFVCQEMKGIPQLKSMISKGKFVLYLIFLVSMRLKTVNCQSDSSANNSDKKENCILNNTFTFGLSLTYASTSLITLICVSLWSFKSTAGLETTPL